MRKILNLISQNYMILVFVISGGAFFTSLYFSNIMDLSPCVLCWYQRILFYPIFFLSAVSLGIKEKLSPKYILALALPGAIMAFYHYGIQKLGIPQAFVPCVSGVACEQIDWNILGFITIPLLSFLGFVFVVIISMIKLKYSEKSA